MKRFDMSARGKSGKCANRSGSFWIRIIQETLPVGRRICTSAHKVHQQLHCCLVNMDLSVGFGFKPTTNILDYKERDIENKKAHEMKCWC